MKRKIISSLLVLVLILSFGIAVPAVAAEPDIYSETWGEAPNTVDVVIEDTGDGWLQWTYTYPETTSHTPKMTVAIDYPNGFCITTFDDGSHDGWYYAPDNGDAVWFADYSGGTYLDWAKAAVDNNVLTVGIKKGALNSTFKWHGYANVNGQQVWIEMDTSEDPYVPTGLISLTGATVEAEVVEKSIKIVVNPTTIDFGPIIQGSLGTDSLNVTNHSNVPVSVTAGLVNEVPVGFYTDNLKMDGDSVGAWSADLPASTGALSESVNIPLTLEIPVNAEPGPKTGTIIFWVEEDVTPTN